ncbi:hypothetical protein [Lysobacter sp. FW306-1B-D06B]|uniref:hypothetical protein n=1 Tax=Lysobacter sp. FW306-1B-D06B TaxID=3140250 RepID=UPI0031405803
MSYDLVVHLKRCNMPSPRDWQTAIVEAGFPVQLDAEFDVDAFSGFLPCPVAGEVAGFEYYASGLSMEDAMDLELAQGTNFSVQFSCGSQPLELVAAISSASVLAQLSGGRLDDPQLDESISAREAIAWAKARLARERGHAADARSAADRPWWKFW